MPPTPTEKIYSAIKVVEENNVSGINKKSIEEAISLLRNGDVIFGEPYACADGVSRTQEQLIDFLALAIGTNITTIRPTDISEKQSKASTQIPVVFRQRNHAGISTPELNVTPRVESPSEVFPCSLPKRSTNEDDPYLLPPPLFGTPSFHVPTNSPTTESESPMNDPSTSPNSPKTSNRPFDFPLWMNLIIFTSLILSVLSLLGTIAVAYTSTVDERAIRDYVDETSFSDYATLSNRLTALEKNAAPAKQTKKVWNCDDKDVQVETLVSGDAANPWRLACTSKGQTVPIIWDCAPTAAGGNLDSSNCR